MESIFSCSKTSALNTTLEPSLEKYKKKWPEKEKTDLENFKIIRQSFKKEGYEEDKCKHISYVKKYQGGFHIKEICIQEESNDDTWEGSKESSSKDDKGENKKSLQVKSSNH